MPARGSACLCSIYRSIENDITKQSYKQTQKDKDSDIGSKNKVGGGQIDLTDKTVLRETRLY